VADVRVLASYDVTAGAVIGPRLLADTDKISAGGMVQAAPFSTLSLVTTGSTSDISVSATRDITFFSTRDTLFTVSNNAQFTVTNLFRVHSDNDIALDADDTIGLDTDDGANGIVAIDVGDLTTATYKGVDIDIKVAGTSQEKAIWDANVVCDSSHASAISPSIRFETSLGLNVTNATLGPQMFLWATNVMTTALTIIQLRATNTHGSADEDSARVEMYSDGTILAESNYWTKVDDTYFIRGNASSPGSPGLQALLQSAENAKHIILGSGYHEITMSSAPQLSGVTIRGASGGATLSNQTVIYVNTGGGAFYFQADTGTLIENLTFDGPVAGVSGQSHIINLGFNGIVRNCKFHTRLTTASACWIRITNDQNKIESCYFLSTNGWPDYSVIVTGEYNQIRNCEFGSSATHADNISISMADPGSGSNEGNSVVGCTARIDDGSGLFLDISSRNKRCHVLNNNVQLAQRTSGGSTSQFLLTGVSVSGLDGYHLIKGNQVESLQTDDYRINSLISISQPYCVIADNSIIAEYYGADDNDVPIIWIDEDATACAVQGNEIYAPDSLIILIEDDNISGVRIVDNYLYGGAISTQANIGTVVLGDGSGAASARNVVISSNYIYVSNTHGSANNAFCVRAGVTDSDRNVICNNIFDSASGGAATYYAVDTDNMDESAIQGNVCASSSTPANFGNGNGTSNKFGTSTATTEPGGNIE